MLKPVDKSSILFIRNTIATFGDPPADRADWLSQISDDTLISEINIPGTHDTAAISTGFNPYACHRFSVTDQLRGGIRLMDIRLKVKKSEERRYEFTTCHGNVGSGLGLNEFQSFPSLLQECGSFLEAHGTETVLTSLKVDDWNGHENDKDNALNALSDLLNLYPIIRTESVPKLKEVRGKILLFNRIDENPTLGTPIAWEDNTPGAWAKESRHRCYECYVQDQYKGLPDSGATQEKLANVISAFTQKADKNVVWNFASATWYGIFGIYIMSGLLAAFGEKTATERWRHFGWVLFDYPFEGYRTDRYGNLDVVAMVIASNHEYREFPEIFKVSALLRTTTHWRSS
ncbi:hypothetical protein [Alcanivorax sp. 24]|uniref:hypothetical protein n=1 Tax=Alcanivorax sp. 24 TaxID=2545266 RepID=UPI00106002C7|nr:hypothetical protein [Alcanivorax sp. 24]